MKKTDHVKQKIFKFFHHKLVHDTASFLDIQK